MLISVFCFDGHDFAAIAIKKPRFAHIADEEQVSAFHFFDVRINGVEHDFAIRPHDTTVPFCANRTFALFVGNKKAGFSARFEAHENGGYDCFSGPVRNPKTAFAFGKNEVLRIGDNPCCHVFWQNFTEIFVHKIDAAIGPKNAEQAVLEAKIGAVRQRRLLYFGPLWQLEKIFLVCFGDFAARPEVNDLPGLRRLKGQKMGDGVYAFPIFIIIEDRQGTVQRQTRIRYNETIPEKAHRFAVFLAINGERFF